MSSSRRTLSPPTAWFCILSGLALVAFGVLTLKSGRSLESHEVSLVSGRIADWKKKIFSTDYDDPTPRRYSWGAVFCIEGCRYWVDVLPGWWDKHPELRALTAKSAKGLPVSFHARIGHAASVEPLSLTIGGKTFFAYEEGLARDKEMKRVGAVIAAAAGSILVTLSLRELFL